MTCVLSVFAALGALLIVSTLGKARLQFVPGLGE